MPKSANKAIEEQSSTIPDSAARRCVFLLLPRYAPIDVSSAVAVLHAANQHADKALFSWEIVTENGKPQESQNGLSLAVDGALGDVGHSDLIFVCGGDHSSADNTLKTVGWLRKARRIGAMIVSLGGGTVALAQAGMLKDRSASVHWLQRAAVAEANPEVEVRTSIFSMDMNIVTCAGGASTVDMMLHLVARLCDTEIATGVADRLACSTARTERHDQVLSDNCRSGVRNQKLADALAIMRIELEEPWRPSEIATHVGMSTRQLERLFSKHLGKSPKSYYLKLRLEHARSLIQQTNMRLIDVAMASGFSNQSYFSRVYRKQFGTSPHLERGLTSSGAKGSSLAPKSK